MANTRFNGKTKIQFQNSMATAKFFDVFPHCLLTLNNQTSTILDEKQFEKVASKINYNMNFD